MRLVVYVVRDLHFQIYPILKKKNSKTNFALETWLSVPKKVEMPKEIYCPIQTVNIGEVEESIVHEYKVEMIEETK